MRFRVLGPVEVLDDEGRSVDVGGAQSRAVLAMLLVADDRIVPVETILDRLWPERQPAAAGRRAFLRGCAIRRWSGPV